MDDAIFFIFILNVLASREQPQIAHLKSRAVKDKACGTNSDVRLRSRDPSIKQHFLTTLASSL